MKPIIFNEVNEQTIANESQEEALESVLIECEYKLIARGYQH
jgi:hypothetical protein